MTTTDEVRDAFESFSTASFDESAFDEGIQVTVSEEEAGQLFEQIRVNEFDAETTRLGDSLVSRIEAEQSDESKLAELFG